MVSVTEILERVRARSLSVGVLGMGPEGVALARSFAREGLHTVGFDLQVEEEAALRSEPNDFLGDSTQGRVSSSKIRRSSFSSDVADLSECEALVIVAALSSEDRRKPDLGTQRMAALAGGILRKGTLVVVESADYPAAVGECVQRILERESGWKAGVDFLLSFAVGEIDPDGDHAIASRVVGGATEACLVAGRALCSLRSSSKISASDLGESCRESAEGARSILFLDTMYPAFLDGFRRTIQNLSECGYDQYQRLLMETRFGDSDSYALGMRRSGWRAEQIVANCQDLQSRWARENGVQLAGEDLLVEQVRRLRPDVLYFQNLSFATAGFLERVRPFVGICAGQIASPLPDAVHLGGLDAMFTSFPHWVDKFRQTGLASWYMPLAFDPRNNLGLPSARDVGASFVGGLSPDHLERARALEEISRLVPMEFWGYGAELLPAGSSVRAAWRGEAWGRDMFHVLGRSRITLNHHIDCAERWANNMRLFEATGCGALLLTDAKENLGELFVPDQEVVTWRTPQEAADKIRYFLAHPDEASEIARAGQSRTLREHTYDRRMAALAEILERQLQRRRERPNRRAPDLAGISRGHVRIAPEQVQAHMLEGWRDPSIPASQRDLVEMQLDQMYSGKLADPYRTLAQALKEATTRECSLLEIGCASGYYCEVLEYLLGKPLQYTGVDYSAPMIELARHHYPQRTFVVADGADLPFPDASFDVTVSSCVLLHVPNWREHLRETVRVAKDWVVAARTPITRSAPTSHLRKLAYGVETVELSFNEGEFLEACRLEGLEPVRIVVVSEEPGSDQANLTYVFRKTRTAPASSRSDVLLQPRREIVPEIRQELSTGIGADVHSDRTEGAMRHYCTSFDKNYLARALALFESLERHSAGPYKIFAVCLDEDARAALEALRPDHVVIVPVSDLEKGDAALDRAKRDGRNRVEYYWTLTPTILLRLLDRIPTGDALLYLDADLFFFSAPEPVFEEFVGADAVIHEHRFTPSLAHLAAENGRFNVGLVGIRNSIDGRVVANWWRDRCIEWCFNRYEDGKMGDQLYLDQWPRLFPTVKILSHKGIGVAPWNFDAMAFSRLPTGQILVDGSPLIFVHVQSFQPMDRKTFLAAKHATYPLPPVVLDFCYGPYCEAIDRGFEAVRRTLGVPEPGLEGGIRPGRGFVVLRKQSTGSWKAFPAEVPYLEIESMESSAKPILATAIVSTYKSEKFLRGCLEDLVAQTLFQQGKLEILVIDAGSPEGESDIALEFATAHPDRVRYLRTSRREPLYTSWNRGVRAARGQFLTNANTDDRHREDALERLAEELSRHPDVNLVYADCYLTYQENATMSRHIRAGYLRRPDWSIEAMMQGCHMGPQPMWRRSVHERIGGFDEGLKASSDYEFWCRMAASGMRMRHVPEFLGLYLENPQGISNADPRGSLEESLQVKRKYMGALPAPMRDYTDNYFSTVSDPAQHVQVVIVASRIGNDLGRILETMEMTTSFPHVVTVVDDSGSASVREMLRLQVRSGRIHGVVQVAANTSEAVYMEAAKQIAPTALGQILPDSVGEVGSRGWLDRLLAGLPDQKPSPIAKPAAGSRPLAVLVEAKGLLEQNRQVEAENLLRNAHRDTGAVDISRILSQMLFEQKRYSEGCAVIQEAVRRHPDRPELLSDHAALLMAAGRGAEAVAPLRKLLVLTPNDVEVRSALRRLGQTDFVAPASNAFLTTAPSSMGEWETLALHCAGQNDRIGLGNACAEIVARADGDPDALKRVESVLAAFRKSAAGRESALAHRTLDGLRGLEIGGAAHNPFGLDTRNVGMLSKGYVAEQIQACGTWMPVDIQADAAEIPVPDESEDFVVSSHVLEHPSDVAATLLEWFRIVRNGGYLFIVTPLPDASPADHDKVPATWAHVFDDLVHGAKPEGEPEQGLPGHGHYHLLTLDSLKEICQGLFGDRCQVVAEQEKDDKVGNGCTIVVQKIRALEEAFPWTLETEEDSLSLARETRAPGVSRLGVAESARVRYAVAAGAQVPADTVERFAKWNGGYSDFFARGISIPVALAADPRIDTSHPGWFRQASEVSMERLETLGLKWLSGPSGSSSFFDHAEAAASEARRTERRWFGVLTGPAIATPRLLALVRQKMSENLDVVLVGSDAISALDFRGAPVPGSLDCGRFDLVFCRLAWWNEHREEFRPAMSLPDLACALFRAGKVDPLYRSGHLLVLPRESNPDSRDPLWQAWKAAHRTSVVPNKDSGEEVVRHLKLLHPVAPKANTSLVNIGMITYNRLEFTRQVMAALRRDTLSPHILTVIDNASTDGSREYLKELKAQGFIDNLVLLDENVGVAKASNLAWSLVPEATHYMKLDNDIVFLKDAWLNELVRVVDAIPELGAVSYNFEPQSYPVQEVRGIRVRPKRSNLGGACILIPKRTQNILGVWSEDYGIYGEEDWDYGVRIALSGLVNAYLEDEDIGFHLPAGKAAIIDDVSFLAKDGEEEVIHAEYRRMKDACRAKNHNSGIVERNIRGYRDGSKPLKAVSKFVEEYRAKASARPAGKTLTVLVCSHDHPYTGSAFVRVLQHLLREPDVRFYWSSEGEDGKQLIPDLARLLGRAGRECLVRDALPLADVVLVQRTFVTNQGAMDLIRSSGKPWVLDVDDLLWELPSWHPEASAYAAVAPVFAQAIRQSSAVFTSTIELGEAVERIGGEVHVVPNLLDDGIWPPKFASDSSKEVIIGYAGGHTHSPDLALVEGVLERIAKVHGRKVGFRFLGCWTPRMAALPNAICSKFQPHYASYSGALASSGIHIALAPLDAHPFNECKSSIKYLEYSACGITGVYADLAPYRRVVKDGENGFLAGNDPERWFQCLDQLVRDRALRERIAENAMRFVLGQHTLRSGHSPLVEALRTVFRESQERRGIGVVAASGIRRLDEASRGILANRGLANSGKLSAAIAGLASSIKGGAGHVPLGHSLGDKNREDLLAREGVSIVMLVRDCLEITRECLESLEATTPEPHEVILVDNGSNPEVASWLRQWVSRHPNAILVRNEDNRGFAGGNNQGLALARGRYLLLLNNDTVLAPQWLSRMLSVFRKYPECGAVGPVSNRISGPQLDRTATYGNNAGRLAHAADRATKYDGQSEAILRVVGFCLLFRREVLESIGGLDERFGRGNFEDDDFCLRIFHAGWTLRMVLDSFVHHVGGATFRGQKIDYSESLLTNWAIFLRKWGLPEDLSYDTGYPFQRNPPKEALQRIEVRSPELDHDLREGRLFLPRSLATRVVDSSGPEASKLLNPDRDLAVLDRLVSTLEAALGRRDLAEAEGIAMQAIREFPEEPLAWVTRSMIHRVRGEMKDALKAARKAVELRNSPEAALELVQAHLGVGNRSAAQKLAMALESGHAEWCRERIGEYRSAGKPWPLKELRTGKGKPKR